eukprot:6470295-Amphidinium_carterae.2
MRQRGKKNTANIFKLKTSNRGSAQSPKTSHTKLKSKRERAGMGEPQASSLVSASGGTLTVDTSMPEE